MGVNRPGWWSEHYPEHCEHGHDWGPGRVIVAWRSCRCDPAVAAAGGRGSVGHVTVSCRAEGCKSIWYKPRHEPEGGHMLLFISLGTIELP